MGKNYLYYGDNLTILRDHIASASVDLVYLDPPFNSNRSYNVLFKNERGAESDAQITAFEDTWHWNHSAEETYLHLVTQTNDDISKMIGAMRSFIGENQMMAYLVMMAARLVELHRVLKPTGSLYLHCDPTASHYLKVILDTIFGPEQFISEIVWKRWSAHGNSGRYGAVHDVILFYGKTQQVTFNKQFIPYDDEYIRTRFKFADADGRRWAEQNLANPSVRPNLTYPYTASNGVTYHPHANGWKVTRERMAQLDREGRLHYPPKGERLRMKIYLDEQQGAAIQDLWTDIYGIGGSAAERLGYPTQKPLTLLERIIGASSNPGDVVLDPFCGCGTAIAAAQKLGRQWIGIDITHLSSALMKYRLNAMFPDIQYAVGGEPQDVDAAGQLAKDDRYQFQWWALSLIKAQPLGGDMGSKTGKKGSDKGIDGVIPFIDDATNQPKRVIVQVKSGHVKSGDIRDLVGTIEREKAAIGVFITLEAPSRDMITEAATAGFYHSPGWNRDFPRLQILTIADLMKGHDQIQMPPEHQTFKQPPRARAEPAHAQTPLFGGDADEDGEDGEG